MGIYERPRIKGKSTFQVKLRRNGLPPISKSFTTREEAERWEREIMQVLDLSKGTSIVTLLNRLASETGKSVDVILENALHAYAALLQTSSSPQENTSAVVSKSLEKGEPRVEDLSQPLSELLSHDQLRIRVSELEKFVTTISPAIPYQEPTGQEYPIMVDTIQIYETLLLDPLGETGYQALYTNKSHKYEFVLAKPGLADLLKISIESLEIMIARQEIPLPGAYSLERAAQANGQRKRGARPIASADAWTLMQAAAIFAGHGKWLAKNDVSPNWYRYLIADSEMALMLPQQV